MKKISKYILNLILIFNIAYIEPIYANCVGKFINPITDVCWSCIFPISLGAINLNNSRKDTPNPSSPICACNRAGSPIPVPGVSLGFWEPVRLVEVTRTPFCLVNMNGLKLGSSRDKGGFKKAREAGDHKTSSYYHIHYYIYPLIYWLNLLTDFGCLESGGYDLAYMSEYDPAHNNDSVANFLNPEVFLFSNPLSVAACSADCIKANISFPIDSMFWCAGCLGSMYPFSGHVSSHIGGVQASSLLATRTIAKLHRMGMARRTATDSASINGPLCSTDIAMKIPKSQYKLQMTYPVSASGGELACNPLGMAEVLYSSGKEFPYKGEDFGYLLWRKRNCCFL